MKDRAEGAVPKIETAAIMISTGVAFLQCCGIVLYPIISPCANKMKFCGHKLKKPVANDDGDDSESIVDCNVGYHDSILNESQPLLPTY